MPAQAPDGASIASLAKLRLWSKKEALFWQAVWKDPTDFLERLASRFLGVLLWYEPLDREREANRPWYFSRAESRIRFLSWLPSFWSLRPFAPV